MLILTRRIGESILIGNNIKISVLAIYKKQIKLRIHDSEDIFINKRVGSTFTIRDDITVTIASIIKKQVKFTPPDLGKNLISL